MGNRGQQLWEEAVRTFALCSYALCHFMCLSVRFKDGRRVGVLVTIAMVTPLVAMLQVEYFTDESSLLELKTQ